MDQIDTVIRLMAVGATMLLLAILLAGRVRVGLKVPLAGLAVGAAAYLVNSSPLFSPPITSRVPFDFAVDFISLLSPFWIWLFARRLFEREPPQWVIWGFPAFFTLCLVTGKVFIPMRPLTFAGIHIAGLILVADLLYTAWSGRKDDLIEKRRMIRVWLPLLVGVQAGGILLIELIIGNAITDPIIQAVNAFLIFALTLFCGIALFETNVQLLVDTNEDSAPPQPAASDLSPAENVLREKLDSAMAEGFYRTPGLSIAALADHLQTPEHRLRALINQRLGFRNFSTYLNGHRIAEAKQKLSDKAHVDLPVLTIAMDLGYNSLPTFNRAFRSETGMAPTDFRRSELG